MALTLVVVSENLAKERLVMITFTPPSSRQSEFKQAPNAVDVLSYRPKLEDLTTNLILLRLTRCFAWGPRWTLRKEPRRTDLTQVRPEADTAVSRVIPGYLTASHHAMALHGYTWQSATESPAWLGYE